MIGNYKWGLKTSGNLDFFAKIYFALQAISERQKRKKVVSILKFDGEILLPDTKLVTTTIEFLKDTYQDFLLNHCFRTYVFGNIIGKNENIPFDKELLAISSLLHDIGLTKKHGCKHISCNCFAIEGAIEAGLFLEQTNLEQKKISKIQDAISLHLNIKVSKDFPEAFLLNKGAAIDVIGQNFSDFSAETMDKILEKYPRLLFKKEMHELMKHQCKIRPKSRISFLYQNGFATLIKKSKFDE